MIKLILCLAAAAVPASALAWPQTGLADPYGARSIARDSFTDTGARLEKLVERGDKSPEVLLNLAAIRLKQRDTPGAHALYQRVLAEPNVDLRTLAGTAWSHDIARTGLARDTRIASR